jgi:MarR family transcriptional regulator, 2-MHQ and catechol-resistance regulon repressor
MPRSPGNSDRHSLATMLIQNDKLPSVAATKTLIRAAFLLTNGADRPHIKLGMSLSEVDVLGALARSEAGLNCSEIAETTLITKGGITGILDRLAARRLVERVPSRDDRRSIMIQLTEKGVEVCHDLFPKLARNNEEIFAKALKPDQIKQFCKLITMLIRSFEVDTHATRAGASEATHGHERI